MSRLKHFLSVPKRIQILTIALVIFIPIWLNLPDMSEDLKLRPLYYLWSKGLFPLNQTVLNDFSRDSEYQAMLIRKPIEVLIPLFPELTKTSDYNPDSERYKYSQKYILKSQQDNLEIDIDDIYWLSGNKDYASGFYAIIYNGNIVDIKLLKG